MEVTVGEEAGAGVRVATARSTRHLYWTCPCRSARGIRAPERATMERGAERAVMEDILRVSTAERMARTVDHHRTVITGATPPPGHPSEAAGHP